VYIHINAREKTGDKKIQKDTREEKGDILKKSQQARRAHREETLIFLAPSQSAEKN